MLTDFNTSLCNTQVDKEGNPRGKVQKCSVAVVTDFGEESREYHKLQEFIAKVQE